MNIETDRVTIPLWVIWVIVLVAITAGLGCWYYKLDATDVKLLGLVGGVVSGLVIYICTFVTILRPLQELERFKRMGVRNLLANRHDKAYYKKLLTDVQRTVDVMGASCTRFIDDFLDLQSDDKILVDALRKHQRLRVRLLVPTVNFMTPEATLRAHGLTNKIAALQAEFGLRIDLRRFQAAPQHSFVVADDDMVAGPIFEGDASRHAPAVHVSTLTEYAAKYRDHFETVWNAARAS